MKIQIRHKARIQPVPASDRARFSDTKKHNLSTNISIIGTAVVVAEMVTNLFFGITLQYGRHRWASSLKQQSSIIVYRLATKENKLPFLFAASKRKFVVSVFHLQHKKTDVIVFVSSVFCMYSIYVLPFLNG